MTRGGFGREPRYSLQNGYVMLVLSALLHVLSRTFFLPSAICSSFAVLRYPTHLFASILNRHFQCSLMYVEVQRYYVTLRGCARVSEQQQR